jgi:hypothetical protein
VFKYKAAFAATVALVLSMPVRAGSITDYLHFELGAGVSWYQPIGDGVWVQYGMPHNLNLSAPVLMGGLTGPVLERNSWGVDWHIDYVYLARVTSQCSCTPIDSNYNVVTHALVPNPVPVPNAQFDGSGDAQGIAITLEPYLKYRGWRLGVSAGLFPYRPSWNETITGWTDVPGTATTNLTANTPHAVQLGELVGVSIGHGPVSVSYQHYWLPTRFDSAHFPAIWAGADVIMATYRF